MSISNEKLFPLMVALRANVMTAGVSPRTGQRWTRKPVRGAKLESVFVGGKVHTSAETIVRFLAAINPAAQEGAAPRSPTERNRASEAAARELDALGI